MSSLSLVFFLLILTSALSVLAQDWPQDYLNAHNAARAEVGVGPMSWDDNVASYAQWYANTRSGDCSLTHSRGPYGENLAWSGGYMSGTAGVQLWLNERPYYDYYWDACTWGQQCRHYTQIVWRSSTLLGCGKATCSDGVGTFVVCSYYPPGNYVGQRPF